MIRSSPTHILFCRISSVAPRAVFGTFLMSNSLSDTGLAILWDIIGGLLVTCSEYRDWLATYTSGKFFLSPQQVIGSFVYPPLFGQLFS